MSKLICKRCLLREMSGQEQALRIIEEYKSNTSNDEAVSVKQYESRLDICKSCKFLNQGTCLKKGAYVEAFCYRQTEGCPLKLF